MTASQPKNLFLDLDDTIIAFSDRTDECWRGACARFAPRLPGCPAEALLPALQRRRDWFWSDRERHRQWRQDMGRARREIIRLALADLGLKAPDVAAGMAAWYHIEREAIIALFPGAVEALARFRALGLRLALLTNGSGAAQRAKIERFELAPYFDCIVVEGELGVGKPDERVYRHALAQLRALPEETWMVGDNLEWDVAAPQRLGITAVWLDCEGTGLPAASPVRPDRIVRSLAELAKVLSQPAGLWIRPDV